MTDPTSPSALARWQGELARLDALTPCFIVGPMKTGTTWLVRALGLHPEIAALYETHAAEVLLPKVRDAFDAYRERLDAWGPWPHTGLLADDELFLQRTIVDRLLIRYARATGKWDSAALRVVADKTPMHAFHVDELAAMYPRAKFILCTRDVRDAAVSAWKQLHQLAGHRAGATFEEYARYYTANLWADPIAAARRSFDRLDPDRWMTVEYEAHKQAPVRVLRQCFAFLGVDASESRAADIAGASGFKRFAGREAGDERPGLYRKGVVGDWANHMTPEFGDELRRLAHDALGQAKEPSRIAHEGPSVNLSEHSAA